MHKLLTGPIAYIDYFPFESTYKLLSSIELLHDLLWEILTSSTGGIVEILLE